MGLANQKHAIRTQAQANRRAQPDKDRLSRQILSKFLALPEYERSSSVLFYVDVRDEVRTRDALPDVLASGKQLAVPYCVDDELKLFQLERLDELEPGKFGILEPKRPLRDLASKRIELEQLDLILVPGVAFDRRGARLGHGHGYYDKLLGRVRSDTVLVAVAFECQLFARIPTAEHDVFLNRVLTERASYTREVR